MNNCFSDPTAWVYFLAFLVSLYGMMLFGCHWIKQGSASSVFAYVTFLFLGEAVEASVSLYARFLRLTCDPSEYLAFMSCALWPGRKIITIIAITAIVVHMTWRVISKEKKHK